MTSYHAESGGGLASLVARSHPVPRPGRREVLVRVRANSLNARDVPHEEAVLRIPEHLSFEEGATLPCATVTAWNALTGARSLQAGHTVLTLGTGGVALFALQFAKLFGSRVIATTSSEERASRLKAASRTR